MINRGWSSIDGIDDLTRTRILDACDAMDAIDEAEYLTHKEAEAEAAIAPR